MRHARFQIIFWREAPKKTLFAQPLPLVNRYLPEIKPKIRMSRILYFFVLAPLSKLPLKTLYAMARGAFFLVYRLAAYRKKVVFSNLHNSFPDWPDSRIGLVAEKFYHHLTELLAENIRLPAMGAAEARERLRVINPELLDSFYLQGRSVIIVIGHYNNWEWIAAMLPLWVKHQAAALYSPLSNAFFEEKQKAARSTFGTELVPKADAVKFFARNKDRPFAMIFAADQSPTFSKQVHWTHFLNQDTGVMLGAERFGQRYDYPVVFGHLRKLAQGRYELSFELVSENPAAAPAGWITERHTRLLEAQILQAPEYWLWTHRRWKRKRG
jgi:KDO2-lipid IV(A) lauroyltransferase